MASSSPTLCSRRGMLAIALAGLGLGLGVAPSRRARAGALRFDPIFLELPFGQKASVLRIANDDPAPSVLQMRLFSWAQQGDTDSLNPTPDLVVSPPIATLAPTSQQIVRLFLRQPAGESERYYRLLVEQLPPPPSGRAGIAVAINASLPVIIDTADRGSAGLEWQSEGIAGNLLVLRARNPGTRYLRINWLEAVLPDGRHLRGRPVAENPYLLPGAERHWHLPLPRGLAAHGPVQLLAKTSSGMKTTELASPL